jgi:four helix bundle protein
MHNFKKIAAWDEAMGLSVEIYKITADFPGEEKFGLISQIRRSAVSVSSNIAEGAGRDTNPQFLQFLSIANGSLSELRSQIILSNRLGFISNEVLEALEDKIDKIQRMISNFKKQL